MTFGALELKLRELGSTLAVNKRVRNTVGPIYRHAVSIIAGAVSRIWV